MARIFIDGFESGGIDLWDSKNGTTTPAPPSGMTGSYCAYIASIGDITKTISAKTGIYLAFKWRSAFTQTQCSICGFYKGSTLMGALMAINTGPTLRIYRGSTQIAESAAGAVSSNTTHLIEVYYYVDDVNGRFVVKVDGVTKIDFTGDTKPGTDTNFDGLRLGQTVSTFVYGYFDDFVADDAGWIGDTKIQAIKPNGAGNSAQWTPSAGANWDCVDEVPASDADYVSTNVNDKIDTDGAGNLTGSIAAVKCLQVQARCVKEGAPTPKNIALVVRTSATDYPSGDKAVPTTAVSVFNIWETNPATASAWTESEINAAELGVKSRA